MCPGTHILLLPLQNLASILELTSSPFPACFPQVCSSSHLGTTLVTSSGGNQFCATFRTQ